MLIDEQMIGRRLAFEERDRAFDSPDPSDERTGQKRDDTEMRDEKRDVMFFPGPAREGRDGEIRREKKEPEIEPGRAIDLGARDFRIESRFVERARDRANDQNAEQDHRQLQRRKKTEEPGALPARA
jgi:hypothetical protein